MKIILVAPGSDFSDQIERAFSQEGHEVLRVDERLDRALPSMLRRVRLLWRLGRRIPWWRRRSNRMLQEYLLGLAKQERPELFFATKGMNIKPETLNKIQSLGIPTACWFPDNAANEPYASWVYQHAGEWDHFFSFDSAIYEQVPMEIHRRIHMLPFAIDPEIWGPESCTKEERSRYECDVCFIGAPYPERVRLLKRLHGLDVRIWGWSGWKNTELANRYRGPLNAKESAKAYRFAKICVNTNITPHAHGVNVKTFEIAAAGGFQLSDRTKDLSTLFNKGVELDVFVDEDDFKKKVQYWLEHTEERRRIARAGQARCLRDHTLQVRMRELLNVIAL